MSNLKKIAVVLKVIVKTSVTIGVAVFKAVWPLVSTLFRKILTAVNKRLRFSITFKTTLTYTMLFTAILLSLGALLTGSFAYFLVYNAGQNMEKNHRVVADIVIQAREIPEERIKKIAELQGVTIFLFDENERLIFSSSGIPPATGTRAWLSSTISVDHNLNNLYVKSSLNQFGIYNMESVKELSQEITYLQGLLFAISLAFLVAIVFMIVIGARTSRRMLRPIQTMTRTARSISAGGLDTRLDVVDSHDELKDLAVTFNEMLDRIQTSFEKQEIFVSDASHELRTPISVIQGYANLLQRWGKEDRAVLQESIEAIRGESDYMRELVEKLLFLASADKKKQQLETAPFALNDLVEEVLRETAMIGTEHLVSGEINGIIMVDGDRALIKQALRIFVDNSLKYTPAGGSITIKCSLKDGKASISVEDNGVGIAEADLPLIFDRFYKADKSRTREGGGAGLGLSIAKWIIEQHQGDIRVKSRPGQGTRIVVILPVIKTK